MFLFIIMVNKLITITMIIIISKWIAITICIKNLTFLPDKTWILWIEMIEEECTLPTNHNKKKAMKILYNKWKIKIIMTDQWVIIKWTNNREEEIEDKEICNKITTKMIINKTFLQTEIKDHQWMVLKDLEDQEDPEGLEDLEHLGDLEDLEDLEDLGDQEGLEVQVVPWIMVIHKITSNIIKCKIKEDNNNKILITINKTKTANSKINIIIINKISTKWEEETRRVTTNNNNLIKEETKETIIRDKVGTKVQEINHLIIITNKILIIITITNLKIWINNNTLITEEETIKCLLIKIWTIPREKNLWITKITLWADNKADNKIWIPIIEVLLPIKEVILKGAKDRVEIKMVLEINLTWIVILIMDKVINREDKTKIIWIEIIKAKIKILTNSLKWIDNSKCKEINTHNNRWEEVCKIKIHNNHLITNLRTILLIILNIKDSNNKWEEEINKEISNLNNNKGITIIKNIKTKWIIWVV